MSAPRGSAKLRPETLTLVEYAAGRLRERILSGELAPGGWVRLDAIADELGMSPIPVREALRMLATEGLVFPQPHRGYTVASATLADLEETYRLRLVLEPLAVRLAVPRLTDADLDQLEVLLKRLADANRRSDWEAYRADHRRLHFWLYDRCGSEWLVRFTDMLWLNTQRYQRMTMEIKGELRQRNLEHRAVVDACRAGDADAAAAAMEVHLTRALESLRIVLARAGSLDDHESALEDVAASTAGT